MEFKLNFSIAPIEKLIAANSKLFFSGSCFSENIAQKFQESYYHVYHDGFGNLFNPKSIYEALNYILNPQLFSNEFLFETEGIWKSWKHHGLIYSEDKNQLYDKILSNLTQANEQLKSSNFLFITFGSAHAYRLNSNNNYVANCHKQPSQLFSKELLNIHEIIHDFQNLLVQLKTFNPALQIVFTVSPVRYIKDGLNQNNLSKGILHLAIHEICSNSDAYYFPSFEIVQDELRDYRFYNEDFAHPNALAINYVWQRLQETLISADGIEYIHQINKLNSRLNHKVLLNNRASEKFKEDTNLLKEKLMSKYQFANWSND